jgi:hypothetical protein
VEIEIARVAGTPFRTIAARFDVSKDAIVRHFQSHVTEKRRAELMAGPATIDDLVRAAAKESKSVLDYLGIMRGILFRQFLTAAENADRKGVIDTSSPLLDAPRAVARLTGELRQLSGVTINQNTINFAASPKFAELSAGLLEISREFPDARPAIISLLRRLDDEPESPVGGIPALEAIDAPSDNGTAVHGLPMSRGASVVECASIVSAAQ